MAEARPTKSLGLLRRALAVAAAVALLFVQGAYTYSEGFSAPGWVFTVAISGLLLTAAFWGAKLKREWRATTDASATLSAHTDHLVEEEDELDVDPAYEVEQRASALAATLIDRKPDVAIPAPGTDREAAAPLDETQPSGVAIRENCLWLMLGLVSLRRARGDEEYVKRPAYLKVQHAVLQNIFNLRREASQQADGSTPEQVNEVKAAMRQVQAGIAKGCLARGEGIGQPEQGLLAWFAEQTGIDLSQSQHVGRALRGKTWTGAAAP